MEKIAELVSRTAKNLRCDVLASAVMFPKTESISNNNPLMTYEAEGSLNIDAVIEKVRENVDLIAVRGRDDIILILKILKDLVIELNLWAFDSIQICRGGLDVLKIINVGQKAGRSAYIEINAYRRRLHALLKPRSFSYSEVFSVAIVVATFSIGVHQWWTRSKE